MLTIWRHMEGKKKERGALFPSLKARPRKKKQNAREEEEEAGMKGDKLNGKERKLDLLCRLKKGKERTLVYM